MIRYVKKTAAILAAVLVLSCILSACAKQPDENEVLLQENWTACLEASEQIYGNMRWAFGYAETFAREGTWESLQKARAACCAAMLELYQLELPGNTMTQEQMAALMNQGVEADVVATELAQLPALLRYKLNTMQCLLYLLRDDVYLAPSAEKIGSWVQSNQDNVRQQCEYLTITTNYLLLQMTDRSLWDRLPEQVPTIGEFRGDWEKDPLQLQVAADRVLDEMALQLDAEAGYLGISEYTLKIVQEAVQTGDLSALAESLFTMEDVPFCFPMPQWLPQELLWYYMAEDENGELGLVRAGDTADWQPAACYIPCDGITMEDIHGYEERLTFWGMDYYSTEENGSYQILVDGGEGDLLLTWTAEETTLYLTEPVGCLMPELYLGAMVLE